MNAKVKIYASIIMIILVTLITVTLFAFAYFTAETTKNREILINANISDNYRKYFSSIATNQLYISVPTEAMFEEVAGSIAGSDAKNLVVTLKGATEDTPMNCEFDFVWETGYDSDEYIPTDENYLEYSMEINNLTTGENVLPETNMKDIISSNSPIKHLSLSTNQFTLKNVYEVKTRLYNLEIPQTIYDKHYTGYVKTANVSCHGGEE